MRRERGRRKKNKKITQKRGGVTYMNLTFMNAHSVEQQTVQKGKKKKKEKRVKLINLVLNPCV